MTLKQLRKFLYPTVLIGFTLWPISCGGRDSVIGGPCTNAEFPGKAEFTELKLNQDHCDAKFDFILTNPNSNTKWLHSKDNYILIQNPNGATTQEWLTSQGIIVGAEFPAIYLEITSGTCTPSGFKFPTIIGLH